VWIIHSFQVHGVHVCPLDCLQNGTKLWPWNCCSYLCTNPPFDVTSLSRHPDFCLSFLWSCAKFSFGGMLENMPVLLEPLFAFAHPQPLVRDWHRVAAIHPRSFLAMFKYLDETSVKCKLGYFKGFFSLASIHMFHFLEVGESSLIVNTFEILFNLKDSLDKFHHLLFVCYYIVTHCILGCITWTSGVARLLALVDKPFRSIQSIPMNKVYIG
jgi:hypothetical protein